MTGKSILVLMALLAMSACSTKGATPHTPQMTEITIIDQDVQRIPGAGGSVWEEPMYDTVRIPAQLDPTGTYYRPAHNTVVEIRRGKYQEVQFPGDYEVERRKR